MTEAWLADAAESFWERAGRVPPFPRDLDAIVPMALPVAVVLLPALTLDRVEAWLDRRGCGYRFPCAHRRLRGCLIAHAGYGIAFVDGADAPPERRFTLAHEAAHFLLDYQRPRQRAIAKLGPTIVDVLDGRRTPTRTERIDAVLAACPIGVHTHLLDRDGGYDAAIASIEDRADRLACELLAPAAEVSPRAAVGDLAHDLRETFGLPDPIATGYARRLLRERGAGPSFVEWLRG
jgi:hypothetical protein